MLIMPTSVHFKKEKDHFVEETALLSFIFLLIDYAVLRISRFACFDAS